jgi:PsbN protein
MESSAFFVTLFLSSLLLSVTAYCIYVGFGPPSKGLRDPFEEHEDLTFFFLFFKEEKKEKEHVLSSSPFPLTFVWQRPKLLHVGNKMRGMVAWKPVLVPC